MLADDRFRYDVLFHTDLSREKGESNGRNLEAVNWEITIWSLSMNPIIFEITTPWQVKKIDTKNFSEKLFRRYSNQSADAFGNACQQSFQRFAQQLALAYEGNPKKSIIG